METPIFHLATHDSLDISIQLNPCSDDIILLAECNVFYYNSPAETLLEKVLLNLNAVWNISGIDLYMARSSDGFWLYVDRDSMSADCGQYIRKVEILLPKNLYILLHPLKWTYGGGPTVAQKQLPPELKWKRYPLEFTSLKSITSSRYDLEKEWEKIHARKPK